MQTFPLIIIGAIVLVIGGIWLFSNQVEAPYTDQAELPADDMSATMDDTREPSDSTYTDSDATEPPETSPAAETSTEARETNEAELTSLELETAPAAARASGLYTDYSEAHVARASEGSVVLFFSAAWCPSCRALDRDITANQEAIPADVTILQVDFDSSVALRQKYGVTTQHTMVQVDQNGAELKQWSGGSRLTDLLAQL